MTEETISTTDSSLEPGAVGDPSIIAEGALTGFVHLLRRAGIVLTVQVIGAGSSYLLQIVLARLLGVSGYGVYAYVVVWIGFGALIAGFGFPAASVRFIPQYRVTEDHARLRGFIRAASKVTFFTAGGVMVAVLMVFLALHLAGLVSSPWIYVWGALMVPAFAGSTLFTELARSEGRVGIAFAPSLIARPALIALVSIALFVLVENPLSPEAALLATLVAGYMVLLLQWLLVRHTFLSTLGDADEVFEMRHWFGVGATLLAASAFTLILMQVDIVLVGAILGARDAGIYAAASKTAVLVTFVIWAVNAAAVPQFTSLWTLGRIDELQRLVTKLAAVIFWPSLAISAVIAALSGPLLLLFGPDFDLAQIPLLILLIGQLVNAAAGSVGYLLIVTGHHRDATRVLAMSAVASIALAGIGTYAFGLVGAAVGTTIGFMMWNGLLYRLLLRKVGIHASIFAAARGSE